VQAKVQLKRSKRKDLYAVLNVAQDASESEIKSAYRKAALRLHPGTLFVTAAVAHLPSADWPPLRMLPELRFLY
jgi:hypothetical protein